MPRALRIEYPGAIYHVMNRDDRAKGATHPERRTGQAGLDDGRVGAATQRRSEKSAHCPTAACRNGGDLKVDRRTVTHGNMDARGEPFATGQRQK